jgi:hypothetical protein
MEITYLAPVYVSQRPRIVFKVLLPGLDPVYMSQEIWEYTCEHCAVVIVEAQKFLQLWRDEPSAFHADVANGNPETWPEDGKYERADMGFSNGKENPVPLADIVFGNDNVPHVFINNGITRTIWLLTKGCQAFPVRCNLSGAKELFERAGAGGERLLSIAELAKIYLGSTAVHNSQ